MYSDGRSQAVANRPEPDIQQGFTLRFGGAYKAGGRQPASVAMRCGLVRQR